VVRPNLAEACGIFTKKHGSETVIRRNRMRQHFNENDP